MAGYRDAVVTPARRATLRGAMVEVVGYAQSAQFVFANGDSQVVDEPTGLLLIPEALLRTFAAAEREGFEVRFRWVRRCYIQDADDLSKFVDRMDFSLTPEGLAHVWQRFGPGGGPLRQPIEHDVRALQRPVRLGGRRERLHPGLAKLRVIRAPQLP